MAARVARAFRLVLSTAEREVPAGAARARAAVAAAFSLRARPIARSARARILVSCLVLLGFSMAICVVVVRELLLIRLDDRVNTAQLQEAEEFREIATVRDPSTGAPLLPNVKRIFDAYQAGNLPGENQAMIALSGRQVYDVTRAQGAAFPLELDRGLVNRWTSLSESQHGDLMTPAGEARYLTLPLKREGDVGGVFVMVDFLRDEQEEIDAAVWIVANVGAGVVLVASLIAYLATGRVLAPLRDLSTTAESITDSDIGRRIDVRGDDEIAQLARTFNAMLDRLEGAFSGQRQFVADITHELRTPITVVRGHLELLGDDSPDRDETIRLVIGEVDRISRFVADLNLLAQAERPDFLRLDPVDLRDLTEEIVVKARGLARREWKLDNEADGVLVADAERLTEAVLNLAQNSVQHTAEGDLIALGSSIEDGWASIWVRDVGPGIDASQWELIFDRFFRGPVKRRNPGGSGLGLAIVRVIAEAHGGRVAVESRPGTGARFTVTVPLEQEEGKA